MADSYQVLYGKYQRAIVSIRELEQEKELYEQQADELRQEQKVIEKNVTELCETILKKDREKKNEKKWFKMPLLDMVAAAQESIEQYFPSIEGTLQKMLDLNNSRTDKILKLEKKVDDTKNEYEQQLKDLERQKDTVINSLTEKLKTGRMEEDDIAETIQKAENSVKPEKKKPDTLEKLSGLSDQKLNKSEYTMTVEEKDGMDEVVGDSVAAVFKGGTYCDISGPRVFADSKAQKKIKNKVKEAVKELKSDEDSEISKEVKNLSDKEKLIIRTMGETGHSEWNDICSSAKEKFPELQSVSSLRSTLAQLKKKKFVEQTNISAAGSPNLGLYRLTADGEAVYEYLFSKEAVEPEMNVIIKNHTSLEHGYGIMRVAALIQKMDFVQKSKSEVIFNTRTKEYMVDTGNNTSYIPDIVIIRETNGKTQRIYIEYETSKCTETDFFAKCYKIAGFSRYINIIVPETTAKKTIMERAQKWKKQVIEKNEFSDKNIVINISSYGDLVNGLSNNECSKGIPWETKIYVRQKKEG